jgi:hypothetical protein
MADFLYNIYFRLCVTSRLILKYLFLGTKIKWNLIFLVYVVLLLGQWSTKNGDCAHTWQVFENLDFEMAKVYAYVLK